MIITLAVSALFLENKDGVNESVTRNFIKLYLPPTKHPSRIAYQCDNPSFSMQSSYWGFEIEPAMKAYSWTKLLLDTNATLSEFDDEVLRTTVSLGLFQPKSKKEAVDVATDYLRHALSYTMSLLEQKLDGLLARYPVDIHFAIPATWSEKIREMSERAVMQAWGNRKPQDTLTLVPEPEAAAEAVLKRVQLQPKMRHGVLVCDCGGGTVVCLLS